MGVLVRGEKFGMLTVIAVAEATKCPSSQCRCECGNIKVIKNSSVRTGRTKSCGCIVGRNRKTHGHSAMQSPTYRAWASMLARCCSADKHARKYYGSRGITVCERWHKFENFLADMGERPAGMTIDRRDNDLGYSLDNCRWADKITQANNTTHNVRIEFRGENLTIAEWSRKTGLAYECIYRRLFAMGWDMEKALTTPSKRKKSHDKVR